MPVDESPQGPLDARQPARPPVKVGILAGRLSGREGGVFRVAVESCMAYARQGKIIPRLYGTEDRDTPGWLHELGVPVEMVDWHGPASFRYAPRLCRAMLKDDLDVLHVHGNWQYPSLAALKWAANTGRPYIVSPHGMLDRWSLMSSRLKKSVALLLYERKFLQRAACIHVFAESEIQSIRAMGLENPICVIPNGVTIPETRDCPVPGWRQELPPDSRVLLFFGRLHAKKGLEELLEAWRMLTSRKESVAQDWYLVIAGWGDPVYEDALQKRVSGLERVKLIGSQLGEDAIQSMFQSSNAFILPSKSEGMPMAVLESWAHAVPVLMTRQCNLPEGFEQGAALELACDPGSIRRGVEQLMGMTDDQRRAMGEKGLLLVRQRFSWDAVADELSKVYAWMAGRIARPECVVEQGRAGFMEPQRPLEGDRLLSVLILTYNEEANLPHCLESLKGLDADIHIVDSGSTDQTVAIARRAGCHVVEHEFFSYADQYNWALDHLSFTTRWIMRLDADESLVPELVEELRETLPCVPADISGFLVKRRVYFWGRWMRHGGYYPTWLLRVWRTGVGRCESRWMDEHIILQEGRTAYLGHDLIDENHKGLGFWIDKHNRYADREVKDLIAIAESSSGGDEPVGQAGRRRRLKVRYYARLPLLLRAFLYWIYRYFILLGFLDGKAGMVFHFLQAFWYRFIVDAKYIEQRRMKK